MGDFQLCGDGAFMPVNLPCPPPFSGPYYYYPYENVPSPPTGGSSNYIVNNGGGGAPISAGAVAGIIILVGVITVMVCFITIKFRTRLFMGGNIVRLSNTRNGRHMELHQGGGAAAQLASMNSGDVLLDVVGGGLEEKLVNLLPVFEYVRFQDDGKELLDVQQKLGRSSSCNECAVCLSLFEEKDIVRILPKCKHVFHLHCIDKWFESHANCPLCRERITLQTIQLYFLSSTEDHAAIDAGNDRWPSPDVDEHDQTQLAVFNACPNGTDHPSNLIENGNNHHNPAPHHHQNYSFSQQAAEPFDNPCAPHDNQIDAPSSAACNDDGHPAPKPYQRTQLVEGAQIAQHERRSTKLTSALVQGYPYHYQRFSFPTCNHAAQSDRKELPACDAADYHTANHLESAPRSPHSPLLSTASKQRGVFACHKVIRSLSQKQRYSCYIKPGQDNENLPLPALVMSSPGAHDSSIPLFKRSHSAGSLIQHYPTSLYSPELL